MKKLLTLCIVYQPPKVLLAMKKRGFGEGRWNGYGGKVKENETIFDAMKREVLEEANIVVSDAFLSGIIEYQFQDSQDILVVYIFCAKSFEGIPKETEEMKPQWFKENAIPYHEMWNSDREWIPLFLQGKKFQGTFLYDSSESHNILNHTLTIVENINYE